MTKDTDIRIDDLIRAVERPSPGTLPGSLPDIGHSAFVADPVLDALAGAAPDGIPPADLFDRIDAQIGAQALVGVQTIPAESGTWIDRGNGVWRKDMATPPGDRKIYLLRCHPGARIPAHTHSGWEYALVLEGRFQIAGRTVRAGDAQYSAANSHHPEITTDQGCLLLVVA